jgi:hypothetical protein
METQLLNHEPINSGGQEIMTHRNTIMIPLL